MSALTPLSGRDAYTRFVLTIVSDHPEMAQGDPFGLASSVLPSTNPGVEPSHGIVLSYGTVEFDDRTLYPLDVIGYSEQPVGRVEERAGESVNDMDTILYAHYTLALDIADIAGDTL